MREGESTSGGARVEAESTNDEARVGGELSNDEVRVGGRSMNDDEASVGGGSMIDEVRIGAAGGEVRASEQPTSESTVKRPKLEDIGTLAAEPLQEWLDSLPRDDVRHVALLLYTNLPRKFGLQKTDTAATDLYRRVSVLSDAGLTSLCKMMECFQTHSKVTMLEATL